MLGHTVKIQVYFFSLTVADRYSNSIGTIILQKSNRFFDCVWDANFCLVWEKEKYIGYKYTMLMTRWAVVTKLAAE